MPEEQERSFESKVIRRAWFAAWRFFEATPRKAIVYLVLVAVGAVAYYVLHGVPATKEQLVPVFYFTIGPLMALWALLFIWHLWLAPAGLAYEAARQAEEAIRVSRPPPIPAVDWAPWKLRINYTLPELAAILAKEDPNSQETSKRAGYLNLVVEAADAGNIFPLMLEPHANPYATVPPGSYIVSREGALRWAQANGFDVSHIV